MLQLSENGNEVCGFPEWDITANSLYEHERVYNLSRCLDRIICAWLASLLLGIHTHPSFRSLHRVTILAQPHINGGKISISSYLVDINLPSSLLQLRLRFIHVIL